MALQRLRRQLISGLLLVTLAVGGCATPTPHRGDGAFANSSWFFGPVYVRGYTISMPKFNLGAPHEATYELSDLANIREKCGVYLAIEHPASEIDEKQVEGFLKWELMNSKGEIVMTAEGRLGDFIWSDGTPSYKLYKLNETFFTPDSNEDYRLRITYLPDPQLDGAKGFVYLRSGGSI